VKLNLARLPRNARLLADLLGLEATLALVQAYGGRSIWPAKGGAAYAALAETIGEPAAAKFVRHFREPVFVPRCDEAIRAAQREAIRAEFDALTRGGLSARQAVARLAVRYTDRHVWRILSSTDDGEIRDAGQAELF